MNPFRRHLEEVDFGWVLSRSHFHPELYSFSVIAPDVQALVCIVSPWWLDHHISSPLNAINTIEFLQYVAKKKILATKRARFVRPNPLQLCSRVPGRRQADEACLYGCPHSPHSPHPARISCVCYSWNYMFEVHSSTIPASSSITMCGLCPPSICKVSTSSLSSSMIPTESLTKSRGNTQNKH